jgi:hypothetical protein
MPRFRGTTRVTVGPPGWGEAEAFVRGWIAGVGALPDVVRADGEVEPDAAATCRIRFEFDAADAERAEAFASGDAMRAGLRGGFDRVSSDQHGWMGSTDVEELGAG